MHQTAYNPYSITFVELTVFEEVPANHTPLKGPLALRPEAVEAVRGYRAGCEVYLRSGEVLRVEEPYQRVVQLLREAGRPLAANGRRGGGP